MLIFVLNSQLLSVSGDSKTLTRRCVCGGNDDNEAAEDKADEDGKTFFEFGFAVFSPSRLRIYMELSIRKFICKCSLIYSCIHTFTGIDQFNLIFFSPFLFSFPWLLYPLVRWAERHILLSSGRNGTLRKFVSFCFYDPTFGGQ